MITLWSHLNCVPVHVALQLLWGAWRGKRRSGICLFYSRGKLDLGHWNLDSQTKNGTVTRIWVNVDRKNGIWANVGLGEMGFISPFRALNMFKRLYENFRNTAINQIWGVNTGGQQQLNSKCIFGVQSSLARKQRISKTFGDRYSCLHFGNNRCCRWLYVSKITWLSNHICYFADVNSGKYFLWHPF